jgi:hypothetical protein
MFLPKFKLVLICAALVLVRATEPNNGSTDLSEMDRRDEIRRLHALDEEGESIAQPAASEMDPVPVMKSELRGRSLDGTVLSDVAKTKSRSSTSTAERSSDTSANQHSFNLTSDVDASLSAVYYDTSLTCDCYTGGKRGRTRLCLGPSSGQDCPWQYSNTRYFWNFLGELGQEYYFYCWCPPSTTLVKRAIVASISYINEYNYEIEEECTGSLTTKGAFSLKCSFALGDLVNGERETRHSVGGVDQWWSPE